MFFVKHSYDLVSRQCVLLQGSYSRLFCTVAVTVLIAMGICLCKFAPRSSWLAFVISGKRLRDNAKGLNAIEVNESVRAKLFNYCYSTFNRLQEKISDTEKELDEVDLEMCGFL